MCVLLKYCVCTRILSLIALSNAGFGCGIADISTYVVRNATMSAGDTRANMQVCDSVRVHTCCMCSIYIYSLCEYMPQEIIF